MPREHVPPPEALVAALVRAGVSLPTALAMERYKAVEIIELLPEQKRLEHWGPPAARGTI